MHSVFITGGSKGIGKSCVEHFSKLGYATAFTYNSSEKEALDIAKNTGAFPIKCDVSSFDSVKSAIAQANNATGRISVLINCAGISMHGLLFDMSPDDWHKIQDTNASSMFYTCKEIIPQMLSVKYGRIINISSVWGVHGASCEAAYSASKASCIGLTKSLAKELAPSGITVNAIAPGVIDTDMFKCYSESDRQLIVNDIPMGRPALPIEVAYLAAFLASDNASYITGQVIGIDGGFGQ